MQFNMQTGNYFACTGTPPNMLWAQVTVGTGALKGDGKGGSALVTGTSSYCAHVDGTSAACGSGSVTSVDASSPLTGGPITGSGTIACATCVIASSPGIGIAHFAGSTQTVTSSTLTAGEIPAALSSTTSVNGTTIASSVTLTQTIASGTSALATSAIASGACATAVTTAATGTATTDAIIGSFNGDPTAVTGYSPTTNGMLTIIAYPTANNVNWKACNNTSASITPGAITLNWRVVR